MKRIVLLGLMMVLLESWAAAVNVDTAWHGVDNTFLYERYAQRPGLTVAQLIHFPVGEGVFVNGLMIQPDDSVSWEKLYVEFFSQEMWEELINNSQKDPGKVPQNSLLIGDKNDPTKDISPFFDNKDWYKTCAVVIDHTSHTIWIFHYNTQTEFDRFIKRVRSMIDKRLEEQRRSLSDPPKATRGPTAQ